MLWVGFLVFANLGVCNVVIFASIEHLSDIRLESGWQTSDSWRRGIWGMAVLRGLAGRAGRSLGSKYRKPHNVPESFLYRVRHLSSASDSSPAPGCAPRSPNTIPSTSTSPPCLPLQPPKAQPGPMLRAVSGCYIQASVLPGPPRITSCSSPRGSDTGQGNLDSSPGTVSRNIIHLTNPPTPHFQTGSPSLVGPDLTLPGL